MYCGTELHANCELIFAYTKEFSLSPKNYVVDYYRLRKSVKNLNKRRWGRLTLVPGKYSPSHLSSMMVSFHWLVSTFSPGFLSSMFCLITS